MPSYSDRNKKRMSLILFIVLAVLAIAIRQESTKKST